MLSPHAGLITTSNVNGKIILVIAAILFMSGIIACIDIAWKVEVRASIVA
jgi:hypothetical protein